MKVLMSCNPRFCYGFVTPISLSIFRDRFHLTGFLLAASCLDLLKRYQRYHGYLKMLT